MVDADDHFFAHPAVGVEIPVEVRNVLHGVIYIVGKVDEVEVGLGDQPIGEEVVCDKSAPSFPIVAVRAVDHHDGDDGHFSGLHEGEDFEALVMRSKSAREESKGAGLLGEVQFAGEKIIEVDELWVAVNGRVGGLFEWEPDIESETLFGPCPRLGGAHDAIATACDEHVTGFDDFFPESEGLRILGLGGFRAGAAEDGYLADAAVACEDAGGGAHFAQGAAHELEFGDGGVIPAEPQRGVDHLLDVSGGFAFGDFSCEGVDAGIGFFFFHERRGIRLCSRSPRANAKRVSIMTATNHPKSSKRFRSFRQMAFACLLAASFPARAVELSIPAGGTFDPFLLALKPGVQMSPLPAWMEGPASIKPEAGHVEIPISPLWKEASVEMYAVTVVFEDTGDGGPALEWKHDEEISTVSNGLGEVGNPVGLNSRTVLLPQSLTKDGGTLVISYVGKFDSLLSLAVRPARLDETAVLGGRRTAALIDDSFQAYDDREVSGARPVPLTGDVRVGTIVEAELSAAVEPLNQALEFVAPVDGIVEGAVIHLEALGLDPEAELRVSINATPAGQISFPSFALDDPSLVTDWNGRLLLAGWRKGSLFVPARHFKQGENTISIGLKRSEGETGREVFLRNTSLHLRFTPPAFSPLPEQRPNSNSAEVTLKDAPLPVDFHAIDPILPLEDGINSTREN
jgi:hypothetical protein